jgi:hypothetical protein
MDRGPARQQRQRRDISEREARRSVIRFEPGGAERGPPRAAGTGRGEQDPVTGHAVFAETGVPVGGRRSDAAATSGELQVEMIQRLKPAPADGA